jgi:hypothetical protein
MLVHPADMNSNFSENGEKNVELTDNNSRKSQGKQTSLAEHFKGTRKEDVKLKLEWDNLTYSTLVKGYSFSNSYITWYLMLFMNVVFRQIEEFFLQNSVQGKSHPSRGFWISGDRPNARNHGTNRHTFVTFYNLFHKISSVNLFE